jgi:RHS repeat-associated protein
MRRTRISDSAGNVVEQQQYDAYGATTFWSAGANPTSSGLSARGNPFGWKGHRVDPETGFVQMRHRYYSVVLGRFLTSDPLGVWGDLRSRGSGYAYCGCRPLNCSDRLGLQAESDSGGISTFFRPLLDAFKKAFNQHDKKDIKDWLVSNEWWDWVFEDGRGPPGPTRVHG